MDKYVVTEITPYLVIDPKHVPDPRPLDDEEDIEIVTGVTKEEIIQMIQEGDFNLVGGWGALLALEKLRELGEIWWRCVVEVSRDGEEGVTVLWKLGQQKIASLFEQALESYLSTCLGPQAKGKIFITESELHAEMKKGARVRGPTPDVLFLRPVSINGRLVKWIDAKMYYASATYANNKKIPNGKLKSMAQRYNNSFGGQGGFVFGQGFCASLQDVVTNALLLDATPLDMSAVNAFQEAQFS